MIVACCALALSLVACEEHRRDSVGTVVAVSYTPRTTSTGFGPTFGGGRRGGGIAITVSNHPEQWRVIVVENGKSEPIAYAVSGREWVRYKEGDQVKIMCSSYAATPEHCTIGK